MYFDSYYSFKLFTNLQPFIRMLNSQLSYNNQCMDFMCLLLSHSWSCQSSGGTLLWYVVTDGPGLKLYAAVTKAHSGWDNGELTAWVVCLSLSFHFVSCCLLVFIVFVYLLLCLKHWAANLLLHELSSALCRSVLKYRV